MVPTARLSDVARAAKVARSTAAQALYGSGGRNVRVSEATARRVRKIAQKLNFRPNGLAQGLRGSPTRSVGAIWSFLDRTATDAEVGIDILCRLQARGLATYQADHPAEPGKTLLLLDDLLQRRLDALIIRLRHDHFECVEICQRLQAFRATVAVVPWAVPGVRIDQLIHDRDPGIRQVVDHFVACGRRKLAIVVDLADLTEHRKLQVFRQRAYEYGLSDSQVVCLDLAKVPLPARERVRRYEMLMAACLEGGCDADAIFCSNHIGVMATARSLKQRGLRVGLDVALAGLNNIESAELWDPPLAMIDRQQEQVVQTICEMLDRRMAAPDAPPQQCVVPMEFVWRESAGGSGRLEGK